MNFGNLKIGVRLGAGFGVVLLLLTLMAVMGTLNMSHLNDQTTGLVKVDWVKAKLANESLDNARGSIARVFQLVASSDDKEKLKAEDRLLTFTSNFNKAIDQLEPLL
jgi:methyl-accepting chemotaxis protein